MTPTAICGLAYGAKAVNTASLRLLLFTPFCAVPVLPAMFTPVLAWLKANAVPLDCWTAASIICPTLLATLGDTAWFSITGAVLFTVLRSLATTDWTRYGDISLPPLAIAAENIASCIAVTVSLNWPMAENAVSAWLGGMT